MDTPALISFLTWGFGVVGLGLLGAVIWFAKRIVAQLDRLQALVIQESHQSDLRLARLEDWRETVTKMQNLGPRGTG